MAIKVVSQEHYQIIYEMFKVVKTSVKIISPFIGADMAQLVVDAKSLDPALDVKIITRFYQDDFIKGVSKIEALEKLNDSGAKIYALKNIHAKLYLFDESSALLGSANFTSGGFRSNHELSLHVENENEINPQLIAYFNDLLKKINESGDFLLSTEQIAEEKLIVESYAKKYAGKNIEDGNDVRFGASISIPMKVVGTKQAAFQEECSNTIWLKFEGTSSDSYSLSEEYSPHILTQFPEGITCYPKSKKPGVKNGDYIYLAVICKGKDELPYIVGRGRSAGYEEGNFASKKMIDEYAWMADFPHYCRYTEFEYINLPISKCISLNKILHDLESSTYISTMGKPLSIDDMRKRHRRQAHIRLTPQAKDYIDRLFDDLVKKNHVFRTGKKYYGVNTDPDNPQHKEDMLNEHKAASYYPQNKGLDIKNLQKGDTVFLYTKDVGIIAYGIVADSFKRNIRDGNPDYEHYVELDEFTVLERPIEYSDINKINYEKIGKKLVPSPTVFSLKKEVGEAILKTIPKTSS